MAKKDEALPALKTEMYPVLDASRVQELSEIISQNLGDDFSINDLEKIKVPSGETAVWTIPTPEGEKHSSVLTGFVVAQKTSRMYWEKGLADDDGKRSAPDCYAPDGKRGIGRMQDQECESCPLNQFGSARDGKGRGKACKEVKNLLFLTEGLLIPFVIQIPPTSLKYWKQFNVRISSLGMPFYGAITNLELKKAKNQDGTVYCEVHPSIGEHLDPEKRTMIASYAKTMKEAIESSK